MITSDLEDPNLDEVNELDEEEVEFISSKGSSQRAPGGGGGRGDKRSSSLYLP